MSNRIVIIVSGGIADWVSDPNVEVLLIDTDNIEQGDETLTLEDIKPFEDLVPEWIVEDIIER